MERPGQTGGSGAGAETNVHKPGNVRSLASQGVWRIPEVICTMEDTIRTIQHALDALLEEGLTLFRGTIQGSEGANTLGFLKRHTPYQAWYTKALRVIRQLYPERSDDFQAPYRALLTLQRLALSPPWYRKALRAIHRLTARRSRDTKDHKREGHDSSRPGSSETAGYACMGMTITPNGDVPDSTPATTTGEMPSP